MGYSGTVLLCEPKAVSLMVTVMGDLGGDESPHVHKCHVCKLKTAPIFYTEVCSPTFCH